MGFNIGDKVKIKSFGSCYTTYTNWFLENNVPTEKCIGYCYGMNAEEAVVNPTDTIFEVIAKGWHHSGDDMLYLIKVNGCSDKSFLIGENGIERYYNLENRFDILEDNIYSVLIKFYNSLEKEFNVSLGDFDKFYNNHCSAFINEIKNQIADKMDEA